MENLQKLFLDSCKVGIGGVRNISKLDNLIYLGIETPALEWAYRLGPEGAKII